MEILILMDIKTTRKTVFRVKTYPWFIGKNQKDIQHKLKTPKKGTGFLTTRIYLFSFIKGKAQGI
jgi:hypothetical protein